MISTIIRLINKYKKNPMKIILFLTSVFIAIITVSIGISSINQIRILAYEKYDGIPANTRIIDINFNKSIELDEIKSIFKEIPEYCNVKIINEFTYIDNAAKNIGYPLVIQVSGDNIKNQIPILKGSYFKDSNKEDKGILIGSELEDFSEEHNGSKEIMIYGEKYNVIGILGYKNKATNWKNRIILNLEDIPKKNLKELEQGSFVVQIESDKGDIDKISEDFKKYLYDNYDGVFVNISQASNKEDTYLNLLGNNQSLFKMIIIVYLISIINLIFISNGWINTIYNEVGIMKSCGMSNFFIIRRIFLELFIISLSATILAIIFQYILSNIVNRIDLMYFYVSLENILIGIGVAFITTILTLISPIISIVNMNPVKFLRS